MERPFCRMAVCALLGICIAAYGGMLWLVFAILLLTGIMGSRLFFRYRRETAEYAGTGSGSKRMRKKYAMAGIQFVMMVFMLWMGWQRYTEGECARAQYLPYLEDDMPLAVQGKVYKKEISGEQYVYELSSVIWDRVSSVDSKNAVFANRILVYSDTDIASVGEIIVVNGKIKLWKCAFNEGNFDEEKFYRARGFDFQLNEAQLVAAYGRKKVCREWLFQLKNRMEQVYQSCLGETECGIMTAMVLGNKRLMDEEVKRLYQIGGLIHVTCVSGLHFSLIGLSVYHFLRKMCLSYKEAALVAGAVMYAYGNMVGMGVSVKRASVMFFLVLGAEVVGRSYDSLNALGAAAIGLLLENPYIFRDAGFQLSFAAVLGVVWVGDGRLEQNAEPEAVVQKKQREKHRGAALCETIFTSMCIQFTTLPLAAWYYYEIPVYATAVNLLVLPCMGMLLAFGICGGIVGLFSERIAKVILFPCQKFLETNVWLCGQFAKLPGAMLITGKPALWKMFLYYLFLAVMVLGFRKLAENTEAHRRRFRQTAVSGVLLFCLLWFPKGGFELDVLDVGQGDGSFVRTSQGIPIFVDGGSSNVKKVGTYRILPFLKAKGVRKIDFWLVSHTDNDHISGLKEILQEKYPVKHLVFAKGIMQDEAFLELTRLAEENATEIVFVQDGDILHLKSARICMAICDYKSRGISENDDRRDKNAESLVFFYEDEAFCGIFTGDIDAATERKLLTESAAMRKRETGSGIDFYKAAHHGSNGSNSEEFLEALHPKTAVISCGLHNSYGHPGAEAVERMEAVGSSVFYTMKSGQIQIRKRKGELVVEGYRVCYNR